MMQPSAQMSDWQECPFLEMTSGARKFGVPQSTLGEVMEGFRKAGASMPNQVHLCSPREMLRASLSPVAAAPWPHPGSQSQVPNLHLHVLVQEEVTCQMWEEAQAWGDRHRHEGERHRCEEERHICGGTGMEVGVASP